MRKVFLRIAFLFVWLCMGTMGGYAAITNGLVVYLPFDGNLNAQAGTTNNGVIYTGGARHGPRYKPGVMGQAAAFANTASGGRAEEWAGALGDRGWYYS